VGGAAKGITPTVSAWLVAWGNRSGLPFPLDERVPFVLFGALWLVPVGINLCLRDEDVSLPGMDGVGAAKGAGAGGGGGADAGAGVVAAEAEADANGGSSTVASL
jgi:hypothetical protein